MGTIIKLRKGENVNLTKQFVGQLDWRVGLKWNMKREKFDLDVMVLQLDNTVDNGGKCIDVDHLTGYMNATDPERPNLDKLIFTTPAGNQGFCDPEKAVLHMGDCRDGEAGATQNDDDEVVELHLGKINPKTKAILILANIYDMDGHGYNFGMVSGSELRVYKQGSDVPEIGLDLKEDFSGYRSLEAVEFYLHNNEWKMRALIQGGTEDLDEELKRFGIPC